MPLSEVYTNLLAQLTEGQSAVLITRLASGQHQIWTETATLHSPLDDSAKDALRSGSLQLVRLDGTDPLLLEPYLPECKLLILGGGHIAQPLCEFAAKLGFLVTVVDDRPYFANRERFPDATQVVCESFERCFAQIQLDQASYVVIATRGHRHDLTCLQAALPKQTAYLGMVGSRRRVREMKQRLLQDGYSSATLARLHAPIGLPIGAVTPTEIAVSILAELVAAKRLGAADSGTVSHWPDQDRQVMQALAAGETDPPLAVATIVGTKGSVPRGTGAKMLVFADGRTIGSVGGGCSEADIIRSARSQSKRWQIYQVDMTGTIAEDAGMVCGGTMDVLIQRITDCIPFAGGEYKQANCQ